MVAEATCTLTFWTSSADPERIVQYVHVEKRKCCEPSAKASGERSMQGEGDAAPSRGVRHSEGCEGRGARVGGARARRAVLVDCGEMLISIVEGGGVSQRFIPQ